MKEVWKDIDDFKGVYQISNLGRLKSFKKEANGKVLSNTNKKGDYFSVILRKGDRVRSTRIHRLVAEAFIPNPKKLSQVHHKDGNKQNNRVENLEWISVREHRLITQQQKPSTINGLIFYNKFVRPKVVQQYSLDGELLGEYNSCTEAHLITKVCARNIHQVASREEYKKGKYRKQAGGYIWKYKDEGGGAIAN